MEFQTASVNVVFLISQFVRKLFPSLSNASRVGSVSPKHSDLRHPVVQEGMMFVHHILSLWDSVVVLNVTEVTMRCIERVILWYTSIEGLLDAEIQNNTDSWSIINRGWFSRGWSEIRIRTWLQIHMHHDKEHGCIHWTENSWSAAIQSSIFPTLEKSSENWRHGKHSVVSTEFIWNATLYCGCCLP